MTTGALHSEVCNVGSTSLSAHLHPRAAQPGQRPPSTAAPGTDHLASPRPRRSPAKDKCALHPCRSLSTGHPCQPHQPRSPLGFLISCSPEAFATALITALSKN